MDVLLPIGEFSKMTYLTVKALRHYHDVGLLEPAAVDPASGYRMYAPDQVRVAQAIRRFRDLDMPLEEIRLVLDAPDNASRNDTIVTHLQRMQDQLERTQRTVASLQALLAEGRVPGEVVVRSLPPLRVVATSATVAFDDASDWLDGAFAELHDRATPTGPDGALYDDAFFQEGSGRVTAFVPVAAGDGDAELPAGQFAVMLHQGPFDELDQTYGALGTYVSERGIAAAGPIREVYLDDQRAEVCWPVSAGGGDSREV